MSGTRKAFAVIAVAGIVLATLDKYADPFPYADGIERTWIVLSVLGLSAQLALVRIALLHRQAVKLIGENGARLDVIHGHLRAAGIASGVHLVFLIVGIQVAFDPPNTLPLDAERVLRISAFMAAQAGMVICGWLDYRSRTKYRTRPLRQTERGTP